MALGRQILLERRATPRLRPVYAAARDLMPASVRKEFPDFFVRYSPHKFQRLSEILFDFPISESVRRNPVIFIHIPKNAGSTISAQLYGAHRGHRSALFHLRADPQHFRSKVSFAVVRNPWSRIVSAYEFGRTLNPNHRPFLNETRRIFARYRTFDDFILQYLWPNRGKIDSLDPIFRHQSSYLCDDSGRILVGKVFQFEELTVLKGWLSEFELELNLEIKINASPYANANGQASNYRSYYQNPLLVDRVRQIYLRDIILFRYEYCA
jgi:Sulfotransferase family